VLRAPLHPYTQRLLACVPELGRPKRDIRPIEGLPPAANALPAGCAFAPRCPVHVDECDAALPELVRAGDPAENHRARCILVR